VSPYRLYALSNVGSLLALLSYPAFFEVKFSRHVQATLWSVGLAVFVLFCAYCAYVLWQRVVRAPAPPLQPGQPASVPTEPVFPPPAAQEMLVGVSVATARAPVIEAPEVTPAVDKLLWISLPAIASILLLATTNKLCQEVAV